jgi:hypothetical protein
MTDLQDYTRFRNIIYPRGIVQSNGITVSGNMVYKTAANFSDLIFIFMSGVIYTELYLES